MAANRTDSPTSAPEAAPADSASAPASAKSGGLGAWLPLLVTLLAMPALAYAMTTMVLVPRLQKGLGISSAATATDAAGAGPTKEGSAGVKQTVPMTKLLVNVAGTLGSRYLLVSLSIVGKGEDFQAKMAEKDAQLRDMAMGALRIKTIADLEKPQAANLIRAELISGFNNILGAPLVQEMFITEFAIQ